MMPAKKTEDKACAFCGRRFNRRRFNGRLEDFSRWMTRTYCSRSCANSNKDCTRTGYMQRAQKHRKACCGKCGSKDKLDVHHKDGSLKNNLPKNLETLCHGCHMRLHWKLRKRGIVFGSHTRISTANRKTSSGKSAVAHTSEMPPSKRRATPSSHK